MQTLIAGVQGTWTPERAIGGGGTPDAPRTSVTTWDNKHSTSGCHDIMAESGSLMAGTHDRGP